MRTNVLDSTSRDVPSSSLMQDVAVGMAIVVVSAAVVWLGGDSTASLRSPWWLVVAVVQCAAVAACRRLPGWALGIAWVGALVQVWLVQEVGPQNVSVLVVLFAVAAHGSRALRVVGFISAVAGGVLAGWFIAVAIPDSIGAPAGSIPFLTALCVSFLLLAWIGGVLRAVTRQATQDRTMATVVAERALYTVAVEEERSRIARDMHDVVAHSLTVMIAQAEGARLVAETQGGASPEALQVIADTGRESLADVRGLLAGLRAGARESPGPSLSRVASLFAQFEQSGMPLDVRTAGHSRKLSTQVDIAAYRILQEALTNALRHGDQHLPTIVQIRWCEKELKLLVRNGVRAEVQVFGRGHGVIGMTERAHLAGGALTVGPAPGEVFEMDASFPYTRSERQ
ncbi:histidine kinase [Rhodococcus sp. H29-C3]|uniref:sensor histidine kinase n=1 Tax=Rhodococcus sp. H29-C3 TaxID=3046307 RepID=UPI0024BA8488|nr:histidine kinase [Rhodococcus sp. H29-C3]MDJ0363404.1 histidine kinase [Rhodococcus sp. H29-C3]